MLNLPTYSSYHKELNIRVVCSQKWVYITVSQFCQNWGWSQKSAWKQERERERVCWTCLRPTIHKELNIRVIRSKVPQNGYILLHLNFVKTGDEIKSQHENSTQREKKGPHKICCHRSFTTTFGLALPLLTLLAAHLLRYIKPAE